MHIYTYNTPGSESIDADPHLFSEPVLRQDELNGMMSDNKL